VEGLAEFAEDVPFMVPGDPEVLFPLKVLSVSGQVSGKVIQVIGKSFCRSEIPVATT
jgi:hypothetical protein